MTRVRVWGDNSHSENKAQCMFSLVQGGICVLGKAHMHSIPSQNFPPNPLQNGSNVYLIDDGPVLSFQGRSSSASSFHYSLLQVIDGVMSLAFYLQVVSQAPQHFFSCEGCFAHQSVCLVISLQWMYVYAFNSRTRLNLVLLRLNCMQRSTVGILG